MADYLEQHPEAVLAVKAKLEESKMRMSQESTRE